MHAKTYPGLVSSKCVTRSILIVFIISIWFLIGTRESHACSCVPPGSPSEELKGHSEVFSGKVVAIHMSNTFLQLLLTNTSEPSKTVYEVKVATVWKGPLLETVFLSQSGAGTSCAQAFREGVEYIVYGSGHLCSRTGLLSEAQEDLAELGEGHAPEPGTRAPMPELVVGGIQIWLGAVAAALVAAAFLGLVVLVRRMG